MNITKIKQLNSFNDEFINILKQNINNKSRIIAYFHGSATTADTSWCPDCIKSDLLLNNHIFNSFDLKNITFMDCPIDKEEYKKSSYSTNKNVQLKRIPTFIEYNSNVKYILLIKGIEIQRLVENEVTKESLMMFFKLL